MAIVIDANLLIVLINGDSRGEEVLAQFTKWIDQDIPLHAPDLTPYEVANALTRSIAAGMFLQSELVEALKHISSLPITYHPFVQGSRVVEIALPLNRQNAYDAACLALAEVLNAELWTLDSPLYRNAIVKGFAVKLLREQKE